MATPIQFSKEIAARMIGAVKTGWPIQPGKQCWTHYDLLHAAGVLLTCMCAAFTYHIPVRRWQNGVKHLASATF